MPESCSAAELDMLNCFAVLNSNFDLDTLLLPCFCLKVIPNNLLYVSRQRHDSDLTCSKRVVISKATILSSLVVGKFPFPLITYFSTTEIFLYSLYRKKKFTRLRKRENMDRSPCSFTRKQRFTLRTSERLPSS